MNVGHSVKATEGATFHFRSIEVLHSPAARTHVVVLYVNVCGEDRTTIQEDGIYNVGVAESPSARALLILSPSLRIYLSSTHIAGTTPLWGKSGSWGAG